MRLAVLLAVATAACATWLLCGPVGLGPAPLSAQQPDPAPPADVPLVADPLGPADLLSQPAAGGQGEQPTTIREQTIYIPYSKLRSVFEKDGRGVFLPYEQFQALWKQARERLVPDAEITPPVKAFITEVASVARVEADVVRVRAVVSLEVLTEGWHEIPLRLSDTALLSARLGDQPARVLARPDAGYVLLLEKQGDQPEQRQLVLEYAKAIRKSPGQNQVAFEAPQAPVNRWEFLINEPGIKVNIHPLIAASDEPLEAPAEQPADQPAAQPAEPPAEQPAEPPAEQPAEPPAEQPAAAPAAGQTRILAFVGAAPTVQFDWTPRAEGATGLAALVNVQTEQRVTLGEGVVTTTAALTYEISRSELSTLTVEVPAEHKVTGVFDANVRQWEVKTEEDRQQITIQLFSPTRGRQQLTIEMERFVTDLTAEPVVVPVIRALNVTRQQGIVMVAVSAALRAEVAGQSGLVQLDASELPPSAAGGNWPFAYRYATLPFELTLRVEKVQPRISTRELVEVYLEPEQLSVELLALLTIERAGVFQIELEVPEGFEVRRVEGQAVAGAEAVVVDSYHRTGEPATRLQVNLARRALGRVALWVELQKRLDDPNLLAPTGEASSLELIPPRVVPAGLEQTRGSLLVYAPESLQTTASEEAGLRAISFQEALQDTQSMRGNRRPALRPILAYAGSREAARLRLAAERRQPHVTVRQLLKAQIEAGVIQYRATFFYEVRYSGLPAVRVDVPADLATAIRNETSSFRQTTLEPQPDDVADGYQAWQLTRDTELLGEFSFQFYWEQNIDELDVGASITVPLPRLVPQGADRAWGQIVLAKAENLDLRPEGEPQGLRPIDPQVDLMPGADGSGAARALEFHDTWSLILRVTRYKLEEIQRTSVERALIRAVVTREVPNRPQQTMVQALFRLRSVRQRLAIDLPPEVEFDANPLRINGQVVNLERGEQDEFFIPLAGRNLDEPLLLELRYTAPGSYREFQVPSFPDEPALQKVFLCAYLPDELAVVGSLGPWTSELILQLREMLAGIPAPRHSDQQLLAWVTEGFDVSAVPDFPTEGSLYVYSALRPPADGSLRLVVLRRVVLNGLVLAIVGGLGLVLLARPLGERLTFLVLVLAAVVCSAVFAPTLTVQLLSGTLAAAVGLVVALWGVVFLVRTVPRLIRSLVPARPALAAAGAGIPLATVVEAGANPPAGGSAAPSTAGEHPFQPPDSGSQPPAASDDSEQQGGSNHA